MSEQEFLGDPQAAAPVTPEAAPQVANATSDFSDILATITNPEGKPKYGTVKDALIGASHAQKHIATLEAENSELKRIAEQVETLKALMQDNLTQQPKADQPAGLKQEDLENLVRNTLNRTQQEEKATANRMSVLNTLKGKFGEKLNEALEKQSQELGLSVAELGALAAKAPNAVLKYFNAESKGTPAVNGTVNTQALTPSTGPVVAPNNIMWGAPTKDVVGFFRQIKEEVNKELGL